ncbi:DUF4238 domain-containing protein [Streptomyces sp. NPDC090135]|uniref:DUF4238 domain-containing protein n=1 Tax=Streptomyces sp. NPDC090135 TaxID=3365957 RepID=UPI00380BC91F
MAERIRRQHTVSKFYLKGFSSDEGRIRRVSLPGEPSVVLSARDASVVKDFYTVTLPDGSLSDYFERAFSKVEGEAAEALRLIIEGEWPIKGKGRASFAEWVALQHLRSEDVRSSQGAFNSEMIRLVVGVSGKEALRSVIEKAEGRMVSDEELDWEWRDITKVGGPDIKSTANQHIRLLTSLLPKMANYLYNCHWTLFRFKRRSIVTSDHPVSLVVAPDYPAWQGVGIATADLFLVPLSRRLALTIQPRSRFPEIPEGVSYVPDFTHEGTARISKSINQETAARARRYVYHHPSDSPLDGLYLPQPETRSEPSMSDASGLIREEGLFSGMGKGIGAQVTPSKSGGRSMTIDDLPWPIPGRQACEKPKTW